MAGTILADSRKADKKYRRENDLTLEFVHEQVTEPCDYCGETELRMTLDRIDNSKGHTRGNVLPACERCNYARRSMPYAAWLLVAAAMREARERGLFGSWTGVIHKRGQLAPLPVKEPPPHGTIARYHTCGPPRCEECKRSMAEWKRGRRSQNS